MVTKAGVPTPSDLRALVARKRVHLYEIAPRVGVNPTLIGKMLNGRAPMSEHMALRILECLESADDTG
jgi:hypothetical protein